MTDAATDIPPVGEIPPFPTEPSGPKDGGTPPEVDSDFIMTTLFGENATPAADRKSAGDKDKGAKPAGDGADKGTAPPTPAPAASGGETAPPAEQPPVPSDSPSQQPGTEQIPTGAPAAPQTPAPGTQPAAPAQPAPAQDGLTPEQRLQIANANALAEQNAQLMQRLRDIEAGKAPAQPQGQPQTGQSQQPGAPQREQVHLAVPDQLYAQVFAEDETVSKQGLNLLVSAVASEAATHVMQKIGPMIAENLQRFEGSLTAKSASERQEEDYYGAFPTHKNPLYRQVIEAEMTAMTQAMPHASWTEDFRNALGARVNTKLQLLGFNVSIDPNAANSQGGQPAQTGNGSQPSVPAPMLAPSSRPAAAQGPEDFIAATFA